MTNIMNFSSLMKSQMKSFNRLLRYYKNILIKPAMKLNSTYYYSVKFWTRFTNLLQRKRHRFLYSINNLCCRRGSLWDHSKICQVCCFQHVFLSVFQGRNCMAYMMPFNKVLFRPIYKKHYEKCWNPWMVIGIS